jgi:hypothetical protein
MVGPPSEVMNCFVRNEASDRMAFGGESSGPGAIIHACGFTLWPTGSLLAEAVQTLWRAQ